MLFDSSAAHRIEDARRVAANSRRWWRNSRLLMNRVMPIAYFDRLGYPGSHDINCSNRPVWTRMPGGMEGIGQTT
nr:hypothetical protein [Burkholderia mayonis]